ncbi:leucine-rich repeat domain-containing protein [Ascoidea rubescens DSM 1968]|uniref:L domain-like protein n=1 Tax=Ascoidea rubescens DSM 1968 TaxID=1344418 RepID=A0A1D2VFP5_9ASCO|nr:L domain-like protein [Ascoidea rubescens DSM 1968]ODV60455.1 L domain-like protein [Ascoidea rubescens DSM 1968]
MEFSTFNCTVASILSIIPKISSFAKLKKLNLSNNKLIDIENIKQDFELISLNLANNSIFEIEPLLKLKTLQKLNLHSSLTSFININVIGALPGLKELVLSSNNLECIPNLKELVNLSKLNIKCNRIESIKFLASLKHLKYLDFSYNQVENVDCLKELNNNLIYLNASFNRINKINMELQTLIISGNKIDDIGSLTLLKSLTFLDMSFIGIQRLPNDFDALENLETLNICRNKIHVPENVVRLDFSFNKIEKFCFEDISEIKLLKYLGLSHNRLTSLKHFLIPNTLQ